MATTKKKAKRKKRTSSKTMLRCEQIEATAATQVRTKLYKDVIDAYREDLQHGAKFPAIDVFCEKGAERWILADGFHRLYAHIHAEIELIEVKIHEGGMHKALLFALQANQRHGLRRTNADKVNAIRLALKDPQISQHTQAEIADIVGVTRETVNRISRRETLDERPDPEAGEPEDNKAANKRATKPEPTQAEIERGELREAMKAIRAFPYQGADALKLELTEDDIADLEYVSTWCAHAVIAYRNKGAEEEFSD